MLINQHTRVLTQGITGREGLYHSLKCREYGTQIVGGVTPGKGGVVKEGFPVFNTVAECVRETGADTSMVFVPPEAAADAVLEAADAGLKLIVMITEGLPINDALKIKKNISLQKTPLIGPNCPGLALPGQVKVGIIPDSVLSPGKIGVVSRSGTLTYEALNQLSRLGLGQSVVVGIGGDPVHGLSMKDIVEMMQGDRRTQGMLLIGEIGGVDEEETAAFIKKRVTKPVAAFIAGASAPEGCRLGHAGAIINGNRGTAQSKIRALRDAGVTVAPDAASIGETVLETMRNYRA